MIADQRGRPRITRRDVVFGVTGSWGSNPDDDVDEGRAGLAGRKRRLGETVGRKLIAPNAAERKVRSTQIVYESNDRDLGRDVVGVDHHGQLHDGNHTTDSLVATVPLGADEDIAVPGRSKTRESRLARPKVRITAPG